MQKDNLKIVIVGGSAGGATLATTLRRLDESSEIIIIERGPDVSFANCSLPYYFEGMVDSIEKLSITTPKQFKSRYNIDARVNEEVLKINRVEKTVEVKNLETNVIYEISYDYLVLSPGGNPNEPKNLLGKNVFSLRNVQDVRDIDKYIKENDVKSVGVIGNGFIGVEVAEAFKLGGMNKVTLFGSRNQVLTPFDEDMAQIIHKEMMDKGVDLVLGSRVSETTLEGIKLESGEFYDGELIILAIGISPETTLVKDAGLKIGTTGGILVDANYKTNDDYIYAVGDAVEIHDKLTGKPTMLALAGPAHRQADKVANHIYGDNSFSKGVINSFILRVFDLNCASVGLNEKTLQDEKRKYKFVYTTSRDKVENSDPIHMKLIFEDPTGLILGAQIIGRGEVTQRINVVSTLIFMGGTIQDMWENELAYSPLYSTPKDITNLIASTGINYLKGEFKKVPIRDVRKLVEDGEYILDTRSKKAFEKARIIGSTNIPSGELRERLNEIPKDKPLYTNSYSSLKILLNNGFTNGVLIDGGYEDLCLYEYFRDKKLNRDPIVTAYRFS